MSWYQWSEHYWYIFCWVRLFDLIFLNESSYILFVACQCFGPSLGENVSAENLLKVLILETSWICLWIVYASFSRILKIRNHELERLYGSPWLKVWYALMIQRLTSLFWILNQTVQGIFLAVHMRYLTRLVAF